MTATMRAADFIGTLGVNTHLDFANYGYQKLPVVEASINYLGLKNLRDSPESSGDLGSNGLWQQVAKATGAKFDAYIPEGSPENMRASLNLMPQLASQGILNSIEGGNEEDDSYAASLGNTLQITASFQQNSVWPTGQNFGLPVIGMSFGAGWTADNGWIGDYASVGDLSSYATYGNAHTYPTPGQTPDAAIERINGLAKLADANDKVITTEIGWDRNQGYSQQTVAKYTLDATLDGVKDGDAKTYFYSLFDDASGNFGLMNQNGTPMAAGKAIHNLTKLLSDPGANAKSFITHPLNYALSGTTSNDNSLLFQKSDGTYWISLWNEVDGSHSVTLRLGGAVSNIKVFDPLSGTTATKSVNGASSARVNLADHPLLIEITPSSSGLPTAPTPQPDDLTVNVPSYGDTVPKATTAALPGASVSDPWAAQSSGTMALNLWDDSGAPLYVSRQPVTGTLHGTINQINADLASLSYSGGVVGLDTIHVDVWNQAGAEVTKSFVVSITPGVAKSASALAVASTNPTPVLQYSNVGMTAASGDHALFIGGTDNVAMLTDGTKTAQAHQRYNAITTSDGNDMIRIGDSGNVADAGTGSNTIDDSGTTSNLVMPVKGLDDVFNYVIQSGDSIDLRPVPMATAWDGEQSTLGHISMNGDESVITVTATANGSSNGTMNLHDSGPLSFNDILGQAMT
jgi:hypothetical protein